MGIGDHWGFSRGRREKPIDEEEIETEKGEELVMSTPCTLICIPFVYQKKKRVQKGEELWDSRTPAKLPPLDPKSSMTTDKPSTMMEFQISHMFGRLLLLNLSEPMNLDSHMVAVLSFDRCGRGVGGNGCCTTFLLE